MQINIVSNKISRAELESFLNNPFPDMIKFVVDVEKEIVAIGGEMHSDEEEALLENGSEQKNLWGGNVYPLKPNGQNLEFSSLINIRPVDGNRSLIIQDQILSDKIFAIINKLLPL